MIFSPSATQLQRRIVAVLGMWLCVLVVSVGAPWMQVHAGAYAADSTRSALAMERVCSGSGQAVWVPSPFAAEDAVAHADASHHLLGCALCLPVWGVGGDVLVFAALPLHAVAAATQAAAQCTAEVAVLPPVRAPPRAG